VSDTLTNADALAAGAQIASDGVSDPGASDIPLPPPSGVEGFLGALQTILGDVTLPVAIPESPASSPATVAAASSPRTCTVNGRVIPLLPVPAQGNVDLASIADSGLWPLGDLPGTNTILRWLIDVVATFTGVIAAAGGVGGIFWKKFLNWYQTQHLDEPLPVADLADMVERGILDYDTAAGEAKMSGVDEHRFANLVANTGEPPGIEAMLGLWRRNLIDDAELHKTVAYSRVRTDFLCHIMQLAYSSMSAAEAIEGYVKGVPVPDAVFAADGLEAPANATEAQKTNAYFAAMFRRAGGLASQWNTLKNAAGNAIGVERAAALEAHELITPEKLHEVILRSRTNPIFADIAAMGNKRWFSAFQIGSILSSHPELAADATKWLLQDGYPPDQVAAYVAAKSGTKAAKVKAETETQILTAYSSGFLPHDQAVAALAELGVPKGSIEAILQTHDARRVLAAQDAVITRIRNMVISGHWDIAKARAELNVLQLNPTVIDHYLHLWQVEADARTNEITSAQVGSLFHRGRIQYAEAESLWQKMGYSAEHIHYLALEYAPTERSVRHQEILAGSLP